MEQVRTFCLVAAAVVLAVLVLATLVRAIVTTRFTDRIIAVNMINTQVVAIIVILSVWLKEDFLVDVALVYALLGFLAVVVMARMVLPQRRRDTTGKTPKDQTGGASGDA